MDRHTDALLKAYNEAAQNAETDKDVAEATKLSEWVCDASQARAAVAELLAAARDADSFFFPRTVQHPVATPRLKRLRAALLAFEVRS